MDIREMADKRPKLDYGKKATPRRIHLARWCIAAAVLLLAGYLTFEAELFFFYHRGATLGQFLREMTRRYAGGV